MKGGNRNERKASWVRQAGMAMAIAFVASMPSQVRADEDARVEAAKSWYASQIAGTRTLDYRADTGSRQDTRQHVRLTSREAGGQRTRYQVSIASAGTAMPETAPTISTSTMIPEDMPVSQTLLTVMNQQGASCGMSALPAMGLTAVGLLGFSGVARQRPQGQNKW